MEEKNVLALDSLCDESQSDDFRRFQSTDCSKHAALHRVLGQMHNQNQCSQLRNYNISGDKKSSNQSENQ